MNGAGRITDKPPGVWYVVSKPLLVAPEGTFVMLAGADPNSSAAVIGGKAMEVELVTLTPR